MTEPHVRELVARLTAEVDDLMALLGDVWTAYWTGLPLSLAIENDVLTRLAELEAPAGGGCDADVEREAPAVNEQEARYGAAQARITEEDRLRAEVERLTAELAGRCACEPGRECKFHADQRAEIERLRSEVERLRAQMPGVAAAAAGAAREWVEAERERP